MENSRNRIISFFNDIYDFGFRNTFILQLYLFLRKLKFRKNEVILLINHVYIVVVRVAPYVKTNCFSYL